MYLATRNPSERARHVDRVINKRFYSIGYSLWGMNAPTIHLSAQGTNGTTYHIYFDEEDLRQIMEAKIRYGEHFKKEEIR